MSKRTIPLAVVLALVLSVVGALPATRARAPVFPETVARRVNVPLAPLVAGRASRTEIRPGGVLRTSAPTTTSVEKVCSPVWFTLVGLVWNQRSEGEAHAVISAGRGNGRFGRAVVLPDETDEAPDPGTSEYHPDLHSTTPLWTGTARCIRFSLRLPGGVALSDLHAVFINTSGTAGGPDTAPPAGQVGSSGGLLGGLLAASSAEAMTTRPSMVRRSEWGAAKPRPNCLQYAPEIKMAYVHHTSGSNSYSPSQSDDIVRGIQYYHERVRGYCDIAYSFLVDRYGTVYEGRAGSITTNVIPGSQSGFNTYTFSVSAMGNYQTAYPSKATVRSIERVLAWRLDVAHVPALGYAKMESAGGTTDRYPEGQVVTLPDIAGHRQTSYTDCPGYHLYALLPHIRKVVSNLGRPKILRPRQSKTTITPVMQHMKFSANATDPLQWAIGVTDQDGNVVRHLYASGDQLTVYWDGTDDDGLPLPPGTYTAVLSAQMGSGARARGTTFPVAINPQPTLST